MSLLEKIQKDSLEARKNGNSAESGILGILISSLKNARHTKQKDLTEAEELKVVFSESKKVSDSLEQFKKANRKDLADREEEQLGYIKKYLPEQVGTDEIEKEIEKAIEEVGASTIKDMGKVMGVVVKKMQGKADGAVISEIVRKRLS